MTKSVATAFVVLAVAGLSLARAGEEKAAMYKALKCPPPAADGKTWTVLDRDGANRQVPRYLSSLGGGEAGTGIITSPPFRLTVDSIEFTLCGHDGQGGGRQMNFVALVDATTGDILRKTMAPGDDAVQAQSWKTAELRDREVRIEAHDGDPGGAFAWLGIGQVDAGPAARFDFREGLPDGWSERAKPPAESATEIVSGGIAFLRYRSAYSLIPPSGRCDIPCGFAAQRLFFLGSTVAHGEPSRAYGYVDVVYGDGKTESYALQYGFTLDLAGKQLSRSSAMYLHPTSDVFQHYFVIGTRPEVIEKVVLRRSAEADVVPRITAVTCQTSARGENLAPLPTSILDAAERAWIEKHAITLTSPDRQEIKEKIRRAHKLE